MANTLTIFLAFLRLGLISFGGPIAHLGYFRNEFVNRHRWLRDEAYSDIVALSQFVPGPASSQTGFALGLMRGGLPGALAAWVGFTLPSALLMMLAAYGLSYAETNAARGVIHGMKLLAVAVVAQAVWNMGRNLCPDRPRAGFAFLAAALLIATPGPGAQLAVIATGALFGLTFLRSNVQAPPHSFGIRISQASALTAIAVFFLLLVGLPALAALSQSGLAALVDAFYRTGALVFGGGHVVLPLLQETVVKPGWVGRDQFLAGYGAAQALPGPLFTVSAFLGARSSVGPGGVAGALVALIAIFLPGMLLLYGVLPFWDRLRRRTAIRGALNGVNAAVVGILGAALYEPIWTSTILRPLDAALALLAFAALTVAKLPVLAVVTMAAAAELATTAM